MNCRDHLKITSTPFLAMLHFLFVLVWPLSTAFAIPTLNDAAAAEALAIQAVRSSDQTLRTAFANQVIERWNFSHSIGLFDRTEPPAGQQIPELGATKPWSNILDAVDRAGTNTKLFLLLRHGQANENLSPSNKLCNFTLAGKDVLNWDSPLTPAGLQQAVNASHFLTSTASNGISWADTLGLKDAAGFTSPLTRTLQTAQAAVQDSLSSPLVASSLVRAGLGIDVCNARHNVKAGGPPVPAPYNSSCAQAVVAKGLEELYPASFVHFGVRPVGSAHPGLISDQEDLWRSDVRESDVVRLARAKAFLVQAFATVPKGKLVFVTTHGEMVESITQATGEGGVGATNAQLVPLVITLQGGDNQL